MTPNKTNDETRALRKRPTDLSTEVKVKKDKPGGVGEEEVPPKYRAENREDP